MTYLYFGLWWLAAQGISNPSATGEQLAAFVQRIPQVKMGLFRQATAHFGAPLSVSDGNTLLWIVGSAEGMVRAYRGPYLDTVWQKQLHAPIETALSWTYVNNEPVVLVSLHHHGLVALKAATGKTLWHCSHDLDTRAILAHDQEKALVSARDGVFMAINTTSGEILWQSPKRLHQSKLFLQHPSHIAVFNRRLFVSYPDGHIGSLSVDNGETLWLQPLPTKSSDAWASMIDPVVIQHLAIFANGTHGILAVDQSTGEHQWELSISEPISSLYAIDSRFVVLTTEYGSVYNIDAQEGQIVWQKKLTKGPLSRPSILGRVLWFGAYEEGLIGLDWTTQQEVYRRKLPDRLHNEIVTDGHRSIATLSDLGYLYLWNFNPADFLAMISDG